MGVREDIYKFMEVARQKYEAYAITIEEESRLFIWVKKRGITEAAIEEARHRGIPIGGPYSGRLDHAKLPGQLDDFHAFARNKELFAMYSDGTRKHGKPGLRIPNRVADWMRANLKDFTVPEDNILECLDPSMLRELEGE